MKVVILSFVFTVALNPALVQPDYRYTIAAQNGCPFQLYKTRTRQSLRIWTLPRDPDCQRGCQLTDKINGPSEMSFKLIDGVLHANMSGILLTAKSDPRTRLLLMVNAAQSAEFTRGYIPIFARVSSCGNVFFKDNDTGFWWTKLGQFRWGRMRFFSALPFNSKYGTLPKSTFVAYMDRNCSRRFADELPNSIKEAMKGCKE